MYFFAAVYAAAYESLRNFRLFKLPSVADYKSCYNETAGEGEVRLKEECTERDRMRPHNVVSQYPEGALIFDEVE